MQEKGELTVAKTLSMLLKCRLKNIYHLELRFPFFPKEEVDSFFYYGH